MKATNVNNSKIEKLKYHIVAEKKYSNLKFHLQLFLVILTVNSAVSTKSQQLLNYLIINPQFGGVSAKVRVVKK